MEETPGHHDIPWLFESCPSLGFFPYHPSESPSSLLSKFSKCVWHCIILHIFHLFLSIQEFHKGFVVEHGPIAQFFRWRAKTGQIAHLVLQFFSQRFTSIAKHTSTTSNDNPKSSHACSYCPCPPTHQPPTPPFGTPSDISIATDHLLQNSPPSPAGGHNHQVSRCSARRRANSSGPIQMPMPPHFHLPKNFPELKRYIS